METYEEFKGKIVLAIGVRNRSIISSVGEGDITLEDLEEYEFNDIDHKELKDLECGVYELEIEYNTWECGYPESNAKEGDSDLKILGVKKLNICKRNRI